MAETARGLHSLQWTEALSLRVRQVNGGNINPTMTDLIEPVPNGRLQILSSGGFMVYRQLDENSVETERRGYPDWMQVSAELVIP